MVWKPHGILDQALVNEIVAFVEAAEERAQKPFNRFADLSALDAVDLNFRFVFDIALHRRLAFESHPPVKTAFYVTSPATTHYAKLHAMLTDHSPLHVSLFHRTRRCREVAWRSSRSTDGVRIFRLETDVRFSPVRRASATVHVRSTPARRSITATP